MAFMVARNNFKLRQQYELKAPTCGRHRLRVLRLGSIFSSYGFGKLRPRQSQKGYAITVEAF